MFPHTEKKMVYAVIKSYRVEFSPPIEIPVSESFKFSYNYSSILLWFLGKKQTSKQQKIFFFSSPLSPIKM